jgi:hypothetical protein
MKRPDNCLSADELADRWDMSIGTLANWRWSKYGPKSIKAFGRVWYPLAGVRAFELKHGLKLK